MMVENPIFLMTIVISLLGVAVVFFLYVTSKQSLNQFKLDKFRPKKKAFPELLNYAQIIDNGVLLNKNGSLTASFMYKPTDISGELDHIKDSIAHTIHNTIKDLNGWMINVDTKTAPVDTYPKETRSYFPDALSLAIDEERRLQFEEGGDIYSGYYVISFTYLPPQLNQQKLLSLLYEGAEKLSEEELTHHILEDFKTKIQSIYRDLNSVFPLTQLKRHHYQNETGETFIRDDLVEFLNYCVSGEQQPIILPDENTNDIDNLIGHDFWTGLTPKVNKKFIIPVALDTCLLQSTHAGILNELATLDCEYRWSTRLIFIPKEFALKLITSRQKKWQQKVRGFFAALLNKPVNPNTINQDAVKMVQDAAGAKADIDSDLTSALFYTSNIILMGEDLKALEATADALRSQLSKFGFKARIESINAVEAYLGSLPAHGYENIRKMPLITYNAVNMLPISELWTGSENATCPMYPLNSPAIMQCITHGRRAFHMNLHVSDLGHFIMLGATRAGKSTHLAMLAMQLLRYLGMQIFAFDKGYSMYPTTEAVGGAHYDLQPDSKDIEMNPFQYMDEVDDRAFLEEWVEIIVALNNVKITPAKRNAISTAIKDMYEAGTHSMSSFYATVQDAEIKEAIKDYTINGLQGRFFDGKKDTIDVNFFVTFEIGELMKMDRRFRLPVLLYIFRRIYKALDGRPAVVLIDEAWVALDDDVFRDKIREFLKAFAKLNCSLGLITQSLEDASNSGILSVIVESVATKIFLANPDATTETFIHLYKKFGLNNKQILTIAQMRKKRDYYFVQNNHDQVDSAMYDLALSPLALSIVGATDPRSIKRIKELVAIHGKFKWIKFWLAEKGLNFSDYLSEELIIANDTFTVEEFAEKYGYELE